MVGITLSQEQVAQWALSHNICTMLSHSTDTMFGESDGYDTIKDKQKEEGTSRKVPDF